MTGQAPATDAATPPQATAAAAQPEVSAGAAVPAPPGLDRVLDASAGADRFHVERLRGGSTGAGRHPAGLPRRPGPE